MQQTVRIKNQGKTALTLQRFYNPCGCLSARLQPAQQKSTAQTTSVTTTLALPLTLAPGGEARVLLRLDLRLLSPGPFEKALAVYTDDASQTPALRIVFKGTLKPAVAFDPPQQFAFGTAPAGQPNVRELIIRPDPRLLSTTGANGAVAAPFAAVPPLRAQTNLGMAGSELALGPLTRGADGSLRCRVTLPKDAPVGAVLGTLFFAPDPAWEAAHPKQAVAWRQAVLPVTGQVQGDAFASPQVVIFTAFGTPTTTAATSDNDGAGAPLPERQVRLVPLKPGALDGATARSDDPRLVAEIVPGAQEDEKTLRLRLKPPAQAASAPGQSSTPTTAAPPPPSGVPGTLVQTRVHVRLQNGQRLVIPVSLLPEQQTRPTPPAARAQ